MLGIPEVIVPPHPGITSAVGLLISDLRYDAIRTSFQVSGAADLARINADFAAMQKELAGRFTADGIDLAKVTFERRGDLRYVGQGYELKVPIPDGAVDDKALAKVFETFDLQIYRLLGGVVSGHSIKHVLAAIGVFAIVWQLRLRQPLRTASIAPA